MATAAVTYAPARSCRSFAEARQKVQEPILPTNPFQPLTRRIPYHKARHGHACVQHSAEAQRHLKNPAQELHLAPQTRYSEGVAEPPLPHTISLARSPKGNRAQPPPSQSRTTRGRGSVERQRLSLEALLEQVVDRVLDHVYQVLEPLATHGNGLVWHKTERKAA